MDAHPGRSRTTIVRRSAVAAGVGLLVALHLLRPDGDLGEATYLAVLVGAGVAAFWGACRHPRGDRGPWGWVALGVCLSVLGDVLYSIYVHVKGIEPSVSIADVPWLASYVAISIGLVVLSRRARRSSGVDVDGLLDMAVVGVVALLIVWQVSVQATLGDASVALGVRVVWASYPILDAALLALVVRVALARVPGARLLGLGVVCWLFADFFYMLFPDSTTWGVWLDAGWMIGAALLAAATWKRTTRALVPRNEGIGTVRILLGIAPLLVPGIIEVITYGRGVDPNPVPLLAASILLAALAFVRAARLLRASARAQADLQAAERHFRALVQRSSDAALILTSEGRVTYVSPAAHEQFGYDADELVGRVGWDLVHPDDLERAAAAFAVVMAEPGAHASAELRIQDSTGSWRWVEEVVTNLLDEPSVGGLVANIRDISIRKAAEQDLSRMAHYDGLTALPNRWLLTKQLDEAIAADSTSIALLVVDLDQFKFVNDSRGHAVGDRLLVAVAERLLSAFPADDVIGRIGGDEFGVICRGVDDEHTACDRAALVQRALGDPIDLVPDGVFAITASVGIAIGDDDASSAQLMQQADTAMYAAKRQGTAQSVVFDQQLRRLAEERLTIQEELRAGLRSGQLVVHYQPVVDLTTGGMEGVEALVRWRHPTRGLVFPGDFIPVAEQSELIDGVSAFVLEQACTDASWWARAGRPMSVAVNLSAVQLRQDDMVKSISEVLYNTGLAPEHLVVEITETALMAGAERAIRNIDAIRALGVRVALDDFGTGFSSLSFLKRVPADIVKIDRLFVTEVATNAVDRDIVAALITLSSALGRSVIAEGVETEAQSAELRRLGCPLAQGFLWSAAVPAEQVLLMTDGFKLPADVLKARA